MPENGSENPFSRALQKDERSRAMYSSAYVWAKVLSYIEERLGPTTVSAWFDDAEVVELNESNLILYSPQSQIGRASCRERV